LNGFRQLAINYTNQNRTEHPKHIAKLTELSLGSEFKVAKPRNDQYAVITSLYGAADENKVINCDLSSADR